MIAALLKLRAPLLSALALAAAFIVGPSLMFEASTLNLLRLSSASLTSASIAEPVQVELPQYWNDKSSSPTRRYEVQVDYPELLSLREGSARALRLLVPYFEQSARLTINGEAIRAPALETQRRTPISHPFAAVEIPDRVLRQGNNTFALEVSVNDRARATLSELYLGYGDSVDVALLLLDFVTVDLRYISIGAELVLAFYCLAYFWTQRADSLYAWLSVALIAAVLGSLSVMNDTLPALAALQYYSFALLPVFGLSFLGFAYRLATLTVPAFVSLATVVFPLALLISDALFEFDDTIYATLTVPVLVLCIVAAMVLIIYRSLRVDDDHANVILIAIMTFVLCILFNYAMRTGLYSSVLPSAILARPFLVLSVIIYLMRRTRDEAIERSAQSLKSQLKAQEERLNGLFKERDAQNQELYAARERQRITAELHDGVAGHLVTILALADSKDDQRESMRASTRHALDELRSVIDTLDSEAMTLRQSLRAFCEKCLEPLSRTGIEVSTQFELRDEDRVLSPTVALNLFRILQEATTNAVRHGRPAQMCFSVVEQRHGVEISLSNSGGAALGSSLEESLDGNGLSNMKARAAKLPGAKLDLRPTATGAELSLRFRLSD